MDEEMWLEHNLSPRLDDDSMEDLFEYHDDLEPEDLHEGPYNDADLFPPGYTEELSNW